MDQVTTTYTILRADGSSEEHTVELPLAPSLDQLRAIILPVLGKGNWPQRVAVLHNARRTDMFVDEDGLLRGLPRNEAATAIYRANWLAMHPGTEPESLAYVVGDVVLFSRPVWF